VVSIGVSIGADHGPTEQVGSSPIAEAAGKLEQSGCPPIRKQMFLFFSDCDGRLTIDLLRWADIRNGRCCLGAGPVSSAPRPKTIESIRSRLPEKPKDARR